MTPLFAGSLYCGEPMKFPTLSLTASLTALWYEGCLLHLSVHQEAEKTVILPHSPQGMTYAESSHETNTTPYTSPSTARE